MHLSRRCFVVSVAALAGLAALPVQAEIDQFYSPGGVAIGGYDAVAYFTDGQAVAGSQRFILKWRGTIWMFASAEHLEAFEMNPAAYAPQYGGYCAVAVSEGQAVGSDPTAFAIEGGRLYLNNSAGALRYWKSDRSRFIQRANEAWPALSPR